METWSTKSRQSWVPRIGNFWVLSGRISRVMARRIETVRSPTRWRTGAKYVPAVPGVKCAVGVLRQCRVGDTRTRLPPSQHSSVSCLDGQQLSIDRNTRVANSPLFTVNLDRLALTTPSMVVAIPTSHRYRLEWIAVLVGVPSNCCKPA
ncbi:hypothetical protein J6590_105689, partial [Homalodisca vitripennis]